MFISAKNMNPGTEVKCDICIVGAGHAGISLAQELEGSGIDVVVLESGGFRRNKHLQDLYKGENLSPQHHADLHMYRERFFGGTSNVWGGRCAPFDKIDLEPRDWIGVTWPITWDELEPYYRRAYELCDIGRFGTTVDELLPEESKQREMIPGFESEVVKTDWLWLFSLPTNFGKKFRPLLQRSENVRVLLHANCVGLNFNSSKTRVETLDAMPLGGSRFSVRAKCYVLCMGALETTRLLLLSEVSNNLRTLGRFYCAHICGNIGPIQFTPKGGPLIWGYEKTVDGVYCRRTMRIAETVQLDLQLPNFRAILDNPPPGDPAHKSSVLSAMYFGKRLLVHRIPPEYARELSAMGSLQHIGTHVRNILRDFPAFMHWAIDFIPKRFLAKRKIPSLILPSKNNTYWLHYDAEQRPHWESQVFLSKKRDALGMPRLAVDYRITKEDAIEIARCLSIICRELERTGVGKCLFDCSTENVAEHVLRYTGVGSHIYGITRMSNSPKDGVVDQNCRVWGVDNLYIVSSGVFPTTGVANPALSIVAFAVRLAHHLKLNLS